MFMKGKSNMCKYTLILTVPLNVTVHTRYHRRHKNNTTEVNYLRIFSITIHSIFLGDSCPLEPRLRIRTTHTFGIRGGFTAPFRVHSFGEIISCPN